MDVARPAEHADVWEKVITKLRMGTMPPVGRPRPDTATYEGSARWLETQIDRAVAAAGPNPGRPLTVHRLNRAEYRNAVRLVAERGVDVYVANADGNTALHASAARGYDSVVKCLVSKGARLDARSKKSTIEVLRSLGAPE